MGSLPARTGGLETKRSGKTVILAATLATMAGSASGAKLLSVSNIPAVVARVESLCALDETVLASCRIRRKMVSVCGRDHRAIYRYGRPDRIELVANRLHYAEQMFFGGSEFQIVSTQGAYRYVVYDSATKLGWDREGHNPSVFSSGLMVLRNGRHLSRVECAPMDRDMIDSSVARNHMPKGEYVWHKGSGPASVPPVTLP